MKRIERRQDGDNERLLGALLRIPYQALTTRIQQGLLAAGYPMLHASHMAVLQQIQPAGSWMSELAERAQMTKQATNYLLEYLEQQGYVERVPDPQDGRAKIIRLTSRGWTLDRQARMIIKQAEQEWADRLGTERMRQLEHTLKDLVALIEEEL